MTSPGGGWAVQHLTGTAAAFHGRELPSRAARRVWVHEVTGPAVVLGSTQPLEAVDHGAADAAGVAVVRRRSGGGAVLVEPGGVVWVDVVVPPGDRLWDDDVARAFAWVGEAWATALHRVGVTGAAVHRGALVSTPWSRLVCFGGLGPGEVTRHGHKVVGIAQRRTRHGARFQCAVPLVWDPSVLLTLLHLEPGERSRARRDLLGRAAAVTVPADALVEAFLSSLPD